MNSELMQRPLRFATAQAYDSSLRGPGSLWVERSAEEFSLDEPMVDVAHGHQDVASALSGSAGTTERTFRREAVGGICANPLRDEPGALLVGAVRRFGLVGLVTCALCTGLARWCRSLARRDR